MAHIYSSSVLNSQQFLMSQWEPRYTKQHILLILHNWTSNPSPSSLGDSLHLIFFLPLSRSFGLFGFLSRRCQKSNTGISGLWRQSVHSDVTFWSSDVCSSYHCWAEFTKRLIVHPVTTEHELGLGSIIWCVCLAEERLVWNYHLWDYNWTPVSQNPT